MAKLLGQGIGYSNQYFLRLLRRMAEHQTPTGFPKYGRLLEDNGTVVGAIILIFSTVCGDGTPTVRCHVTGWYTEPAYRHFATLFFARDLKHRNVTYLNISARSGAVPIIEQQGFTRYSSGQFFAVPALQFRSGETQAKVEEVDVLPNVPFEPFERDLLLTHAKWGCICFWCVTRERAYPFVFRPRLFKRIVPGVQLVYCREIGDFARFVGPMGRYLLLRGRFVVRVDSNNPIPGLIGKFVDNADSRYYKGPKPRLGDLAYTQLAMSAYVPRRKKRPLGAFGTVLRWGDRSSKDHIVLSHQPRRKNSLFWVCADLAVRADLRWPNESVQFG